MKNFSDDEIKEFLRIIGVTDLTQKNKKLNIFTILQISPEIDSDGKRILTPYEILGVPPKFRDGFEVPIIFAIKNKVKKIGKYSGSEKIFYYSKSNSIKKKNIINSESIDDSINELKKKYRHAVFMGNMDEALSIYGIIDSLTGGRALEILCSSFDYTLFYRRMKKQLLIDIFAHFFLNYLRKYRNRVKSGLVKVSKKYKPYFEKESFSLSGDELNDFYQDNNTMSEGINLSLLEVNKTISRIRYESNFDVPFDTQAKDIEPLNDDAEKVEIKIQSEEPQKSVQSEAKNLDKNESEEDDLNKSFLKIPKILRKLGFDENVFDFEDSRKTRISRKISEDLEKTNN